MQPPEALPGPRRYRRPSQPGRSTALIVVPDPCGTATSGTSNASAREHEHHDPTPNGEKYIGDRI